ncbi:L-seryl-tRNA(Sec) selenium transferase [Rossellomorea aquimaris]|uniref:L-seryl-tRNA(Sec) selenium transferase n=1 Tax=Rossellomorea aquimaris TaxID=189382 RepID=UPI001CD7CF4A|nr:L-seryl-tRNA(Sec) selenium transferase [Rossellomorea aquimaris]MCA1053829.1 L-seryl-tRNA(Sec) selenium transferase [Rossellomorea aquimaris]
MSERLRQLPPIHQLQQSDEFALFLKAHSVSFEKGSEILKESVAHIRDGVLNGTWEGPFPDEAGFLESIYKQASLIHQRKYSLSLQRIINASGTILHTNLGRARMGHEVLQHVVMAAGSYTNLEYNLEKGSRGSRHEHAERFICEITGAEAAMVVNNNAAAVFLILSALAKDKEVIVSRSELVEIGGSFRVSSIMEESGAKLVEVGTTNKTHLHDYHDSITEETSMIMKVHQSNFFIKGFTSSVGTDMLSRLANDHERIIYYEDLGSGALYDFSRHGIGKEPLVKNVMDKGADLVSFSGDKLLGGPQAGIIAGKRELIDRLKKHQLARVLRVDKMTLAALEMTMIHYLKGEVEKIPSIYGIIRTLDEIKCQSQSFIGELKQADVSYQLELSEGVSQVGGGTMPDVELPTFMVTIKHPHLTEHELHEKLRLHEPAVMSRIHENRLILDLRAVTNEEQEELLKVLCEIDLESKHQR